MTPEPRHGSPSRPDRRAVAALLGRTPFTDYGIAVRCPFGGPAVLVNTPVDLHGRPFPTRFWLACRALGEAVSRFEAAGGVRQLEEHEGLADALAQANAHHRRLHDGRNIGGTADPRRPKCLHAHLAFGLATGGNPVSDWILEQSGARWPAVCCVPEVPGDAGD